MRMRRPRAAEPVGDVSVVDAAPALPPERPRRRGRSAAAALVLVALLIVGTVALARPGDRGDVLALGAVPDPTYLPPVEDFGSLRAGAADDPSAVIATDPVTGAPAGGALAAGVAGAVPGDPAAAATGVGGGVGAGAAGPPGVGLDGPSSGPVPTAPAGRGTGTPVNPGPGAPPPPPPGPPAAPSPASPACTISKVKVTPPVVKLKGDGQSAQDVRVEFTAVNCSGQFRIVVEAVTRPAVDLGGGAFQATIEKDTRGLSVGDRTILITGAGASTTVGLKVT